MAPPEENYVAGAKVIMPMNVIFRLGGNMQGAGPRSMATCRRKQRNERTDENRFCSSHRFSTQREPWPAPSDISNRHIQISAAQEKGNIFAGCMRHRARQIWHLRVRHLQKNQIA
jgi:hypothetical protein